MKTLMNKVINPVVKWVLRSPLHDLISQSTLLIKVIGRESSKPYIMPVNYVQVE